MTKKIPKTPALFIMLVLFIVLIAFLALSNGIPFLAPQALWEILTTQNPTNTITHSIVWELRLPRLILGLLAGASLALAGVILQDSLQNPLAGPELTGVASGASAMIATLIIFSIPVSSSFFPWMALLGGFSGAALVMLVARQTRNPVHLALVGASVSALLNALIVVLMSFGKQTGIGLLFFFLIGSLSNRAWSDVTLILPWLLVGMLAVVFCARALNALQLGDEVAEGLGLPVVVTRTLLLLVSAVLTAAVVAVCGPIGWVALLAPHGARYLLNSSDARQTLPIAALLGAALLATADLLARLLFAPVEIPVGLWTTLLGGPLLLWLLYRRQI